MEIQEGRGPGPSDSPGLEAVDVQLPSAALSCSVSIDDDEELCAFGEVAEGDAACQDVIRAIIVAAEHVGCV